MVVLDDLHWADPASLGLLAYLGRFVAAAPVVLVGAYREGELELTHPLAQTLADLDRQVRIRRVRLGVLDAVEVRTLLAAVADGPVSREFVEAVARETGGNPFFVSEVALQLAVAEAPTGEIPIPESVRQAIGQRLARLSAETARVLSLAAAFARPFRFDALEALTGLEEDTLLDCIDEALRARMLVALDGERYEFAHALVRHAIYDELSPSRQARLHRRIAEALERLGGDIEAAELASQYYRSRTLPGAEHGVAYAIAAAEQARQRYAYEQAVVFLGMARELAAESAESLRADIASRLAEAQAEAVMLDEARQSTEEALALLESSGAASEARAEFACRAVWALDEAGAPPASTEPLVQRGLALAGTRRDLVWARLKLAEYPLELFPVGAVTAGRWLGYDSHAVAIARSNGDERDYARTIELMDWRDRAEIEELRVLAGTWRDARAAIHVLSVVSRSLFIQHGAFAAAADVAHELRERADHVGSLSGRAYALVYLGWAALVRGDVDDARALLEEARAAVARLGEGHRLHASVRFLAHALMEAERPNWSQIAALREASAADPKLPPWMVLLHLAHGAHANAAADEETAARCLLAELVPVLERLPPTTLNQNGAVAKAAWSAWLIRAPEYAAPLRRAAEALVAAGAGDYSGTSLELAVAWMAFLDGDPPGALEYVERARSTLTASGQRPLLGLVDDAEQEIHGASERRPTCRPYAARARDPAGGGRRQEQPRNRVDARPERAHGGAPHRERLPQDRRPEPRRGYRVRPPRAALDGAHHPVLGREQVARRLRLDCLALVRRVVGGIGRLPTVVAGIGEDPDELVLGFDHPRADDLEAERPAEGRDVLTPLLDPGVHHARPHAVDPQLELHGANYIVRRRRLHGFRDAASGRPP